MSAFVFPVVRHPHALVFSLYVFVVVVLVEFREPCLLLPRHPIHRQVGGGVGFGFEFQFEFGVEVDLAIVDPETQQSLKTFATEHLELASGNIVQHFGIGIVVGIEWEHRVGGGKLLAGMNR